jgi:hypothetical protein
VPRKKSGKRKTPEPLIPLISDGIHFVRDASPKDQHSMRFVVDQHRGVQGLPQYSSLPRHCESLERGGNLMKFYTDKACRESPELRLAHKIATGKLKGTRKKREPKPKKAVFPITRFTCIMANPIAQIWACTKAQWEAVNVGRRNTDKKPPKNDKLPHELGDFAVLKGDDPVLDDEGQVRVFKLRGEAEEMMQTLYLDTPGEDRLSNNTDPEQPTTTVYQNVNYSVHFDPDYNGSSHPFNIYDTRNHKVVLNPRGNFPLKFRSITGAIKEADLLDHIIRGG